MVTAATTMRAGAENSHPIRASFRVLASVCPTRRGVTGACSVAVEMVAINHAPDSVARFRAPLRSWPGGEPGQEPAACYSPPPEPDSAVFACDWAAAIAAAGVT